MPARCRIVWLPGALLVVYAWGHYGDELLSAATGWPLDWSYALCQALGQAALWVVVACLAPRSLRAPAWVVCAAGVADSLMRSGCLVAQLLRPVRIGPESNLCDAQWGIDASAWGLASLAVCAFTLAVWATTHPNENETRG